MAGFLATLKSVISESDIVLHVLDARSHRLTVNPDIARMLGEKPVIYVLNKCDLVGREEAELMKKEFSGKALFVSCKTYHGIGLLKTRIFQLSSRFRQKNKVLVGVVGYPNTGKSSVINALTGRSSAKTSAKAGYTRGKQNIRLARNIYLIDTPGVFPESEKDEVKYGIISAKSPQDIKDPVLVAMEIIRKFIPSSVARLEELYRIKVGNGILDDEYEILLLIGRASNLLSKGGIVDEKRAAVRVIQDWQRGKLYL